MMVDTVRSGGDIRSSLQQVLEPKRQSENVRAERHDMCIKLNYLALANYRNGFK